MKRRVMRGLDRLERRFGRPRPSRRLRPLDELILTILSQNTNDRNRDRAYSALRERFPTWQEVARASRREVEGAIRIGGLARTKSRVIQEVLRRIEGKRGAMELDFLNAMPAGEARRYLASFRGVGEKTVCCVLLFSTTHAAFPVDTHIHRVARRLGWVPPGASPARTHQDLAQMIPARRFFSAHLNLITLGRRLCRPRNPDCAACPLRRSCRYALRARRPARAGSEPVARSAAAG